MDILSEILTSNIYKKILDYVELNKLIPPKSKIIIGLSGGPDSVFLLHFLNSIKQKFDLVLITAHLDHEWRENSKQDLIFCENLARSLDIEFIGQKASNVNLEKKYSGSKEELGRVLRRNFFQNLITEYDTNLIALAHHQDDQEETFFIRLIRGAGISGLASIRPKTGLYIRPILCVNKKEILDFLEENKIKYLIDPTNLSDDFLRNRIRNKVIPALKDIDNRFDLNLLKAIANLQAADSFLEKLTEQYFSESCEIIDHKFYLDTKKFFLLDEFIQDRVILLWLCKTGVKFTPTSKLFDEIKRFFKQSKSKTHQIYKAWQIVKTKNLVHIAK